MTKKNGFNFYFGRKIARRIHDPFQKNVVGYICYIGYIAFQRSYAREGNMAYDDG